MADVLSTATDQFPSSVDAPAGGTPRTSASVRTPMQSITDGLLWLRTRLEELFGQFAPIGALFPSTITVNATSDTITLTGHGLNNSDQVRIVLVGSGSIPGGLAASTAYYVVNKTANTLQLSSTDGGAAIDITSTGSGSLYLVKIVVPEIYFPGMPGNGNALTTLVLAVSNQLGEGDDIDWTGVHTWTNSETHSGTETHAGAVTFSNATAGTGAHWKVSSRSEPRASVLPAIDPAGVWTPQNNGGYTDTSTGSVLIFPLDLPNGQTLTGFSIGIDGNSGHGGVLPSNMPTVELYKVAVATGGVTSIHTETDSTGTAVAYEAYHRVSATGLSEVITSNTHRYFLKVTGESAGSAQANLYVGLPDRTITRTYIGED